MHPHSNSDQFLRHFGRLFRAFAAYLYPLQIVEKRLVRSCSNSSHQPIFIIGAPRSGTTLIYEILTSQYELAYFTNFASLFVLCPVLISYSFRKVANSHTELKMESSYGFIKGTWSPSEVGKIFEYWYQNKKFSLMRDSINSMSYLFDKPLCTKNLRSSLKLSELHSNFPEALFVYVKRNLLYNAQSLILAMANKHDLVGNIRPDQKRIAFDRNFEKDDLYLQAVNDVIFITNYIDSFFADNACNLVEIEYESFCQNCVDSLKKVEVAYSDTKTCLRRKGVYNAINLYNNNRQRLDDTHWYKLKNVVDRMSQKEHKDK